MTDPDTVAEDTTEADDAVTEDLANAYLNALAAIVKWEEEKEQLATELIRRLGVGGRHKTKAGEGVRVAAPARMFNAGQARQVLNDTQYAAICEQVPSRDLAEKMLPGALFDLCKKSGSKPSVRKF
jgi:hypothetical protein